MKKADAPADPVKPAPTEATRGTADARALRRRAAAPPADRPAAGQ